MIIGLRSRCVEAMEAHQLREAEVLATREVMSADSELYIGGKNALRRKRMHSGDSRRRIVG